VLRSIHQSLDLQEVIDNAVESMYVNIDRVDYLGIYLLETQELILKAQRGLTDEFIMSAGRVPFPKGFTWKTVIDGNPTVLSRCG
jgi:putative methionine-R-sulfoxide reductase with GAF domain